MEDPTQHGVASRESGSEAVQESWKLADAENKKAKPKGWSWIPIQAISLRPEVLPREHGEDADTVALYAEVVDELPAIKVQKDTLVLIGGLNRIRAHERASRRLIKAVQIDAADDVLWELAFEDNRTHGLPMTQTDRKNAALRFSATYPDLTDEEIADKVGAPRRTVSYWRTPQRAPTSTTEPDGKGMTGSGNFAQVQDGNGSPPQASGDGEPTSSSEGESPKIPGPPPMMPPLPDQENQLNRNGQAISLGAMFDMVLNQTPRAIAQELSREQLQEAIGQARQASRWFVEFAEAASDCLAEMEMAGARG